MEGEKQLRTPDPNRASCGIGPSFISKPEKENPRKKKTDSNTPRGQIRPVLLPSQRNGGSPDDGMKGNKNNWARGPYHRFCISALVSSWISAPEWVRRHPRNGSSFSSVIFVVLSYIPFSRIFSRFSNLRRGSSVACKSDDSRPSTHVSARRRRKGLPVHAPAAVRRVKFRSEDL